MENLNSNKSVSKYEEQIKLRKEKLEKMRKERATQQINLEDNRLKKEICQKAKLIKDVDIDELNSQLKEEIQEYKAPTTVPNLTIIKEKKPSESCDKDFNLNFSQVHIAEFAPQPKITVSKQTQTDVSRLIINNENPFSPKDFDEEFDESQYDMQPCKFSSNLPPGILSSGLPNIMDVPPAITPLDKANPWNSFMEISKPSEEEACKKIMLIDDFENSIKRVSLIMEKAIVTNKNICIDYIEDGDKIIKDSDSNELLNLSHIFYNDSLTKDRCVTCIDWSTHYSGQIVAAYYKKELSLNDTDGDVMIWNQYINDQIPEQTFHCHSPVLHVRYVEFNPNLILGSTYSGQIVMWDSRVKTPLPVQCSKLNSKAHTQPVYCLRCIGNDNNIISVSLDGKLCSWNLDMLSIPLDVIQLQCDVSEKLKKQIAVTCMDFPANRLNNLVLGGEDGYAYSAFRYGYESNVDRYGKHEAPVTGISSHCTQSLSDFGDLFLTSSIDNTVKLWSLQSSTSIYTFKSNYDYVMDVAWSPLHPAAFIAVDGSGRLDIFNLNENPEEPLKSLILKGNKAINRVAWHSNGQQVSIGTESGELYVYNVADELTNPSPEDWDNLNKVLNNIKSNYQAENYENYDDFKY